MENIRYVLIDQDDNEHYTVDIDRARYACESGKYIVLEIREMKMYVGETEVKLIATKEMTKPTRKEFF